MPRCACGAYGTFGVGVSLRHGKEGTWWCGPCWRALAEWTRIRSITLRGGRCFSYDAGKERMSLAVSLSGV